MFYTERKGSKKDTCHGFCTPAVSQMCKSIVPVGLQMCQGFVKILTISKLNWYNYAEVKTCSVKCARWKLTTRPKHAPTADTNTGEKKNLGRCMILIGK